MIPWVNFGLNNFDSQPWPFLVAIIFLISIFNKIKIPQYSISIFILIVFGLLLTIIMTSNLSGFFYFSYDNYQIQRAIISYLSIPILFIAFYNYFIHFGFPEKLFYFILFLWIFFGIIELFYPQFIDLFSKVRTNSSRGVTSLAPEPSFFGIFLFFWSWILIEFKNFKICNNTKLFLLISFLTTILLAKSSIALLFIIIVTSIYLFTIILEFKIKKLFLIFFFGILAISFFFLLKGLLITSDSPTSRILETIYFFLSFPSVEEFITKDKSFNLRTESILLSFYGAYDNNFLPGGLDTFLEKRNQFIELFDGLFITRGSGDIMSWIGTFIYEMGFIGIIVVILIFKSSYRKLKFSLFYYGALFIILLSAIPLAFPLVLMLFSLMAVNKRDIKN